MGLQTKQKGLTMDHYVVFANGEMQITAHTLAQARREMSDLRKMECEKVHAYAITGARAAEAADLVETFARESLRGLGPASVARISGICSVSITKFTR